MKKLIPYIFIILFLSCKNSEKGTQDSQADPALTTHIESDSMVDHSNCDLRGFTAYTEKLGAAQMALVLREYYETIVTVAKRYGATVKDFAGDGALILVGAPLALTTISSCIGLSGILSKRARPPMGSSVMSRVGMP